MSKELVLDTTIYNFYELFSNDFNNDSNLEVFALAKNKIILHGKNQTDVGEYYLNLKTKKKIDIDLEITASLRNAVYFKPFIFTTKKNYNDIPICTVIKALDKKKKGHF